MKWKIHNLKIINFVRTVRMTVLFLLAHFHYILQINDKLLHNKINDKY